MDWKIFLATMSAIFFAELADKTQMVGIGMSAKSGKPIAVLLGSICGYIIVTGISVFIGFSLGKFIKPELIRYIGSILFIAIGILMLLGKF